MWHLIILNNDIYGKEYLIHHFKSAIFCYFHQEHSAFGSVKVFAVVQLPCLYSFLAEQIKHSCIAYIAHMISFIISENHFSRSVQLKKKISECQHCLKNSQLCQPTLREQAYADIYWKKSGIVDIRGLHLLTATLKHLYREP